MIFARSSATVPQPKFLLLQPKLFWSSSATALGTPFPKIRTPTVFGSSGCLFSWVTFFLFGESSETRNPEIKNVFAKALEKWKQDVGKKHIQARWWFQRICLLSPLFWEKMSSLTKMSLKRVEWHQLVKWFWLFRRLLRSLRGDHFLYPSWTSQNAGESPRRKFQCSYQWVLFSNCSNGSQQNGNPAALARSFRILYGIQKTLKRVSVRMVKDWYICLHGWYGYFNVGSQTTGRGKMVWKTRITHLCRALHDGKTGQGILKNPDSMVNELLHKVQL